MRDFLVQMYVWLFEGLRQAGYEFQTFREYLQEPKDKVVILRHDVDKMPLNSWEFARLEKERGIRASYYFRIVPESFKPTIIRQIHALGHEIGYHYEDLDLCGGDADRAYQSFQKNLAKLRELAPVETACMHGSPLSKWDNRDLWEKHDYRELGIIGEPYIDIDYNKVFYLTDTGRKWNNSEASIRDKVLSGFKLQVKNTVQLIELAQQGRLPEQLMINTHPQRWTDNLILWTQELVCQTAKNQIKKIVSRRLTQKKSAD